VHRRWLSGFPDLAGLSAGVKRVAQLLLANRGCCGEVLCDIGGEAPDVVGAPRVPVLLIQLPEVIDLNGSNQQLSLIRSTVKAL
jgi:hypothetical protein